MGRGHGRMCPYGSATGKIYCIGLIKMMMMMTTTTMMMMTRTTMFVSIASNSYDVLRRLYHEKEACGYNLRTRPQNSELRVKDDNNFVSLSLYAEIKT